MSDTATLTLMIEGAGADVWLVRDAVVRERLSSPTEITVRATSRAAVDLESLNGRDATLEAEFRIDGEHRAFHGIVTEVAEFSLREDSFDVEITIESKLSLLRLGRDHRIFQEMSVPDVVADVLERSGVSDLAEWAVTATYEPHANIVQYGESDYDFMVRLLFEEGIGFIIEQDEVAERLVFFDNDSAYHTIEGDSVLSFVQTAGEGRQGLTHLEVTHRAATDQVEQRDYDLEAPARPLSTTAETDENTARQAYLHPGSYVDDGRGQRLTDRVLERLQMRTKTASGRSTSHYVAAGHFFTAAGHARAALDGDYLALEVTHQFAGSSDLRHGRPECRYENSFELIPLDVPYRPQDAPHAPVLAGVQHALVTVPGGEEIHSEENGRVKVRFLWDRSGITDDKSSTWLRVGQFALGGSMVIPRVDFEMLVDFELGDVDRPAISGHLYNAELAPPYALPGGMTVSSMQTATTDGGPGANELRFEDSAGGEEIFINASKDLNASIDNNTSHRVGNNQTQEIGSNNTLSVTQDHNNKVVGNRSLDVGANQAINVGGSLGDGTGGNLSVAIGGNRMVTVGGDHTEDTTGSLTRTVGSLQCITGIAGVARTVVKNASTDVGAAWAELAGGARGLDITGSYTETIGALKFIKAKSVSIGCGSSYVVAGALEIIKAGGSMSDSAEAALALTAGGKVKVKAKNITFEADSKLIFRGGAGTIELSSSGKVKIKAPTIRIKNSKVLTQVMHKSG